MNPDDLKVFLHVAKTGSISRTAMELGANQSTISRRVGLLETELGVRLLVERRAERHGFTLHIGFECDGSISLTQRLVMNVAAAPFRRRRRCWKMWQRGGAVCRRNVPPESAGSAPGC